MLSAARKSSLLITLLVLCCTAHAAQQPASSIPTSALIQPAALASLLKSESSAKPLILQVGSHVLYAEAHIPGSEYAGPAGDSSGLDVLRSRTAKLSKTTAIVLYCGCCPWSRCPNIAPAYNQLHSLGFTSVKVLYLADDFGTNWVDKGYPSTRGR